MLYLQSKSLLRRGMAHMWRGKSLLAACCHSGAHLFIDLHLYSSMGHICMTLKELLYPVTTYTNQSNIPLVKLLVLTDCLVWRKLIFMCLQYCNIRVNFVSTLILLFQVILEGMNVERKWRDLWKVFSLGFIANENQGIKVLNWRSWVILIQKHFQIHINNIVTSADIHGLFW